MIRNLLFSCCAKVLWLLIFPAAMTLSASSQDIDSMRLHLLDEVVFEGVKQEGDTLQNFYRANASATTESILSRMRGVSLIRRGAYGQEPVFRSLQGPQLNVTIDGMKIFGACTDKMDPVTIYVEPQNLSAIQALSGTQGAEFGSTFGGTLNMKLAEPRIGKKGATGQAGMDYQTNARAFNYFSRINLSGNASAYRLSATYRKSHNYRAGGGEEIRFSQYEKINLTASAKWALGKFDTLRADALADRGYNLGFPALPMDVSQATAGIFALTWHRTTPWLFMHHLTAKIYHNDIAHSMDDKRRSDVPIHMDMPGKSQTTGLFAESDIHIFPHHRTKFKAEFFINRLTGEMIMYPRSGTPMYMQTAPRSSRRNASLFVSQHVRFDEKNKAEFSFRGDLLQDDLYSGTGYQQWEVFYPDLSQTTLLFAPTFSTLYTHKLAGNIRLEVQGGYGQRAASLNERYGYYLFNRFDGFDYLGNPELRNEKSLNAEATFSYFGNAFEIQLTPFYQDIRHYITGKVKEDYKPMTIGANGVKQNLNLPRASLAGTDLMLLARPIPSLQAVATLKFTHGRSSSGEPLPLIPPLKMVTSLRYKVSYVYVQAEWEWAAAQTRVNETSGEARTPAWNLLSLRTGWKINSFMQWNAGVENIFDARYREHLDWGGVPRQGRNFYLNAVYIF